MSRLMGVALAGLAIGLFAGAGGTRYLWSEAQAAWEAQRHDLGVEYQKLKQRYETFVTAAQKLEANDGAESARLKEEIAALRAELDEKDALLVARSDNGPPASSSPAPSPTLPNDERRREPTGQRTPGGSERNDASSRVREGLQAYMDDEIAKTQDADTAQRLSALSDSMGRQMELVQQLRDAKTDAERDSARQSLTELRTSMRELVQTQQDTMLRQFAAQYGVAADQQEQFLRGFRELQASPFFRMAGGLVSASIPRP